MEVTEATAADHRPEVVSKPEWLSHMNAEVVMKPSNHGVSVYGCCAGQYRHSGSVPHIAQNFDFGTPLAILKIEDLTRVAM